MYIYVYTAREIERDGERRAVRCVVSAGKRERERARHMHKPTRQQPL